MCDKNNKTQLETFNASCKIGKTIFYRSNEKNMNVIVVVEAPANIFILASIYLI